VGDASIEGKLKKMIAHAVEVQNSGPAPAAANQSPGGGDRAAPVPFWASRSLKARRNTLPHLAHLAQDLQFRRATPTIRIRNRPAKQVGSQRWLNLHSTNRGSTRSSVLCAVSASPECLMNRGELHRLRTGSPAHCPRPRGPGSTLPFPRATLAPDL
jgi:hypothetical protein